MPAGEAKEQAGGDERHMQVVLHSRQVVQVGFLLGIHLTQRVHTPAMDAFTPADLFSRHIKEEEREQQPGQALQRPPLAAAQPQHPQTADAGTGIGHKLQPLRRPVLARGPGFKHPKGQEIHQPVEHQHIDQRCQLHRWGEGAPGGVDRARLALGTHATAPNFPEP